jgi:methyltransferase family protein
LSLRRRLKSGLRKEQKPWLGVVGEIAWGTSLGLYETVLLGDRSWWWRLHYHLWRAYRDWDPDDVLEALSEEENLGTLAYGETPASTINRALKICRSHFPDAFSLCDLGAGRGVLAMSAAALGWDVLAVEYLQGFITRSSPVSEKLGLSVDWVRGDFLELPLPPADIVHTAATTYPNEFRQKLSDKFADEGTLEQGFLLQDWILDDERFEVLVGFRLPVTWGSSYFTLHRLRRSRLESL